jgi:hypothetical protein
MALSPQNSTMNSLTTLQTLLEQEHQVLAKISESHHLPRIHTVHHHHHHNEIWREHMIQWAYTVVDSFHAPREVVFVFSHILESFLYQQQQQSEDVPLIYTTNAQAYQTLAATAFLIAMKIQGKFGLELSYLVHWSYYPIHTQDIVLLGKQIVSTLSWDHSMPTPVRFIFEYLQVFIPKGVSEATRSYWLDEINFLVEVSLQNYTLSCQPPSLVALMAMKVTFNGSNLLPPHVAVEWTPSIHQHVLNLMESWIYQTRVEHADCMFEICTILQRLRVPSTMHTQALSNPLVVEQGPGNIPQPPIQVVIPSHSKVQIIPFMNTEVDISRQSATVDGHADCGGAAAATLIPWDE